MKSQSSVTTPFSITIQKKIPTMKGFTRALYISPSTLKKQKITEWQEKYF